MKEESVVNKIFLKEGFEKEFSKWQAILHAQIVAFPGFISLEIIAPEKMDTTQWVIIERFSTKENVQTWLTSKNNLELQESLKGLLKEIQTETSESKENNWGVTEVFVTKVSPTKIDAFRSWIGKIHEVESKFKGFKGVYVQSPSKKSDNWITLLQFDSQEHLDAWLTSKERLAILKESEPLVRSFESHRVISPFAGWFASASKEDGSPPVWKQTALVLLVLFPIVMIELKFLSPLLTGLNSSIATFIGNVISVSLISWPLMPLCIYFLKWWLNPKASHLVSIIGFILISLLYILEITFFWDFM